MRTKTICISIALLVFSAVCPAQIQKPSGIVRSFYKFHLAASGTFNAAAIKTRRRWFSADLNMLFHNELKRQKAYLKINPTDKPHFGDGFPFQPFEECSQGGRAYKNTYIVIDKRTARNTATVEIKFYGPKKCGGKLIDTYEIEMIKTSSSWLINDWIYSNGETLTSELKRADY